MSSISKLSIQGIRSFGADQNQIIDFKPPLTLILGQNGSGKTTIIECLRYVITGDMPPNCGRGGSFVRDPKVAHEMCVKGKILLSFKDVAKKRYLVTRLLEVTQHAKDLKFRTVNNTIVRKDENGANVQVNSRCADIDREMCSLLGVSRAILNNVIFCHQEDSNWPLSEGKSLKQKFDDIFAATRYIKALETIRKERLSLQSKVKEYEIELKYLSENKDQVKKLRNDMDKQRIKLLSSKNRIKEIDKELQPVEKNLEAIFGAEDKVNQLKKQIAAQEATRTEIKKKQMDLKEVIHILFHGTREELEQQIKEFQGELQRKKQLVEKLKEKATSTDYENRLLKEKKSKLTEQLGAMISQQQNHVERTSRRDDQLISFCNELNILVPSSKPLNERDVNSLIPELTKIIRKEQEQLRKIKTKYETDENELQNCLDATKEERTKMSHCCALNAEQMKENTRKISSITEELSQVDALANKRAELEENIQNIESELEEKESSEEYENIQEKLNDAKKEKNNIEVLLNQLNNEFSKLQREHDKRTEVDHFTKEKNRKLAEIDKIKTRYHDVILHLLGKVPEKNVHQSVQKYISQISHDLQSNNDDIEKKKVKMSSLETTRQHLVNNLRKKEEELETDKRKVFQVCGNDDFDSCFSRLESKIKELQDEKGSLIGSQYIFTTYKDKLKNVSPCCPLCHRGFKEDKEAKDLISELENKMKMVPSQLRTKQKNIEEYQEKLNKMTELRPIREGIAKLEKDIPGVREELESCSAEIEKYQKEIEELNETLESNKSDHAAACNIVEHAIVWDQCHAEVKRLEDKIKTMSCFLGNTDMSRNIETVCNEQDAANRQLDSVKISIEQHQKKLEEYTEDIQHLKTKKNDLRSELLQITSNLQQQSSREEQRKALSAENVELENSIKKAKTKLLVLEEKVKSLQKEKEILRKKKDEEIDKLQEKISRIEKQLQDIITITRDISKYIVERMEKKLKLHQEKQDDINKEITAGEELISQLHNQMSKLNNELSSHQIKKRELEDNLKLIDCTNDLEEINMTIFKLQQQLDKLGIASLLQKQELLKKRDDLSLKQQQALIEQTICEKEIQRLQDLEGGMYKDADLKHHNKLIEIRTNELATQDLNKYYIALDHAIMRYHSIKMEEINKIVRDLWVKTYVGNDIDYIEIRSDAQEGNTGLDKRRVYNYKVVMIKGDAVIDMRGRCSAGQKVLASLIIRLALAETFCLNCGILALDEPTTNLDRDNIESLAQALAEIVKSRSHQNNFQLIVITHDEDFIELLGRSDTVEHFYRVSRDFKGLSRIEKARVQSIT